MLTELVIFCLVGIIGSVLAKEGRLSNVSDFVSGAFKVLIWPIVSIWKCMKSNNIRGWLLSSLVLEFFLQIYLLFMWWEVNYPPYIFAIEYCSSSFLCIFFKWEDETYFFFFLNFFHNHHFLFLWWVALKTLSAGSGIGWNLVCWD